MQNVSLGWIDNQAQPFISEAFVEIAYDFGDPDAQTHASAHTTALEMQYSNVSSVARYHARPRAFATLEKNIWTLNGRCSIMPDDLDEKIGYTSSDIADESGHFATQTLSLVFDEVQTQAIPGISIVWSDEYSEFASSFTVTSYLHGNPVNRILVSQNTNVDPDVEMQLTEYDRIDVSIDNWCFPKHRARVSTISVGNTTVFDKSSIISFTHDNSVDPISASLPKSEIRFELSNLDDIWNPINPRGRAGYLAERQEIRVRYGYAINGEVEWIPGGVFFLTEWDTPSEGLSAVFTARDAFEFMSAVFDASAIHGPVSLYDIAESAFIQAKLPLNADGTRRWHIAGYLKNILAEYPNSHYNVGEVVQLCANASGCVLFQDRNGQIHIDLNQQQYSLYGISTSNTFTSKITLTKELASVNVNSGMAIRNFQSRGLVQYVDNPFVQTGSIADNVALWVGEYLKNRDIFTGEWRADVRLDPLDIISISSKYGPSTAIVCRTVYTFAGAWRGTYEAKKYAAISGMFSGEMHSGELNY